VGSRDPSIPLIVIHPVEERPARLIEANRDFLVGHDYYLEQP
jgi:hypothetical protein